MITVLEENRTATDDDLVSRVRGGDKGLYEMLMRRYNQRVFRVIRSVVTNDDEAEDVLQEACSDDNPPFWTLLPWGDAPWPHMVK